MGKKIHVIENYGGFNGVRVRCLARDDLHITPLAYGRNVEFVIDERDGLSAIVHIPTKRLVKALRKAGVIE